MDIRLRPLGSRLATLALCAALAGCGFALRGADVLPPDLKRLHVVAPADLRNDVAAFLETSDTQLVDSRSAAQIVLTISNPRYDRRVLSVDPNTGKEREFEISYTVDVTATGPGGRVILDPQPMTLLRDFVFDRETLIGTSREEGVLYVEMRRDAVQQIFYRLRAATSG